MKIYKSLIYLQLIVFLGCINAEQKPMDESKKNIVIYMIGDSTMANKKNPETKPEYGRGQVLSQFFNDNVLIKNKAVNGRSSKSFISENRWDSIYNNLNKGDYVFIQFGHNDQKDQDPNRYTNPHTGYRNNLIKYVKEVRQKKPFLYCFHQLLGEISMNLEH